MTSWQAYEAEFGPLGGERGDALAAMVMTTIANGFAAMGGGKARFKVDDFLVNWSGRQQLHDESSIKRHANMQKFEDLAAEMGWE